MARRLLAIAAATGRVSYVFFIGRRLLDWRVSEKAAKSPSMAAAETQKWINELQPDVLVTEKPGPRSKKDGKTLKINAAIVNMGAHNYLLDISAERAPEHANKYDEAKAQAQRYPEISAWLPKKRRFFDNESRNIVLFEALSLAENVLDGRSPDQTKTAH